MTALDLDRLRTDLGKVSAYVMTRVGQLSCAAVDAWAATKTLHRMRDGGEDGPCASTPTSPATPQQASGDPAVDRQPVAWLLCAGSNQVTTSRIQADIWAKHNAVVPLHTHPAPKPSPVHDEVAGLRDVALDLLANLTAANSLLSRSPKKAAPSNKMFDQMLTDYKASENRARAALANPPAKPRRVRVTNGDWKDCIGVVVASDSLDTCIRWHNNDLDLIRTASIELVTDEPEGV